MTDRELMQEVLDFLVGGDFAYPTKLATALRSRLAQPEQEPVAYRYKYPDGFWRFSNGERVNGSDSIKSQALYTTPPQRKPLTVDEVWQNDQLMSLNAELGCGMDLLMEVVEAIEAAHNIGEKPDAA